MIRKIKIIVVLFFLARVSVAQSPGYMGKKVVVGYGFNFNPAFTAALIGYGDSPFNIQHDFFIEGVVAKKVALGVSLKLYKSSYNNTSEVDLNGIPVPRNYHTGYSYQDPEGEYRIKARNYAFYAKFFKEYYVAPWGKYFLLGITLNTYQCSYDPDQMHLTFSRYDNSYNLIETIRFNDFGLVSQSFKYPDIMIGKGKSRVFANRVVLDYGYNINVIAMALTVLDAPDDDGRATYLDYIKVTSGARVRGINRFNFYFKLGYLF